MRILTVVMAAAVSLSATTALAAEDVGEVMSVTNAASISGQAGDPTTLTDETKLFVGDLVATGTKGEAELLFDGKTLVALSANTSVGIDEPAQKPINLFLHEGSIRVVLGGREAKYTFQTDYARIIPLGTAFDLTALPNNGGTEMVLLKGKVILCGEGDEGDDCKTVVTPCALLKAEPGRDVEEITLENDRPKEIRKNFAFQRSESSLSEPFWFADLGCTDDPGGLAPLVLPMEIKIGASVGVSAIILCAVLCPGGGGGSTIDTNNGTN